MTVEQIINKLENEIQENREERKDAVSSQKTLINGRIEGMQYAISLLKK